MVDTRRWLLPRDIGDHDGRCSMIAGEQDVWWSRWLASPNERFFIVPDASIEEAPNDGMSCINEDAL